MAMTASVKDELSRLSISKPCCRKAEVSSILRFAGGLHISSGKIMVEIELDGRKVDFEYDGEMGADVALSKEAMALYPFCRLTGPANVLVMPAAHSASISTKMLQQLGGVTVVGPLLTGLDKPVQIASMSATASDIVNLAAIAAYDINR